MCQQTAAQHNQKQQRQLLTLFVYFINSISNPLDYFLLAEEHHVIWII